MMKKPLYISTDSALDITGFHDEATPECRYISGGIYCLTPGSRLRRCMGVWRKVCHVCVTFNDSW